MHDRVEKERNSFLTGTAKVTNPRHNSQTPRWEITLLREGVMILPHPLPMDIRRLSERSVQTRKKLRSKLEAHIVISSRIDLLYGRVGQNLTNIEGGFRRDLVTYHRLVLDLKL
jgi:hypothetical protein